MEKREFSYDAESNGLYGQIFCIAAICRSENGKTETFTGRCPITEEINSWVEENVLPAIKDIPENYRSYKELLEGFINFWMTNKEGATAITHMGCPVEARIWIDAHNMGLTEDFDAPYKVCELASFPEIGDSVDNYNRRNGISVEGNPHDPMYDAAAALAAYRHISAKLFTTKQKPSASPV